VDMRKIKTIQDVVDWGLCVGCGACVYACNRKAVSLDNIDAIGIRPRFDKTICQDCTECLTICPGYITDANLNYKNHSAEVESSHLIGPTLEIWEGYATNQELRYRASSGGVLSALSLYCLEEKKMGFVQHTGVNPSKPWMNRSVQSINKDDLLACAGSRYAPSSPCDSLNLIEQSDRPCVFIGKPCDTAAVTMLRNNRPKLDEKIGLVLTFFCAGPPCTQGTLDLLRQLDVWPEQVNELRYRGYGWPGNFTALYNNKVEKKSLTYKESWGKLAKYHRSFRCHLCPDGLGELADISCGDAWHRYSDNGDPGLSLVMVRSKKGREILHGAVEAGYLHLEKSDSSKVLAAQGLPQRRKEAFGRLLAMKLLFIPTPNLVGFSLLKCWMENPLSIKLRTILGTLRRLVLRGLWHRNPVY
jgi:coenzyme F420 hydrogenase subunit beta